MAQTCRYKENGLKSVAEHRLFGKDVSLNLNQVGDNDLGIFHQLFRKSWTLVLSTFTILYACKETKSSICPFSVKLL